ncbi:hypothetical protein EMIT036CA2_30121 [Chryseobacterium sp. IT-36CA2]
MIDKVFSISYELLETIDDFNAKYNITAPSTPPAINSIIKYIISMFQNYEKRSEAGSGMLEVPFGQIRTDCFLINFNFF